MRRNRVSVRVLCAAAVAVVLGPAVAAARQNPAPATPPDSQAPAAKDAVVPFKLGEIVTVVETADDPAGVGGVVLAADEMRRFEKTSLEQAVNLVPGVSSTLDSNGRRNESDIFVRGFGRFQVPLMVDGVRVYLPADNRLDFSRFLTADIAAVQIRKGYASVLDGPGAMGGSINLVTRTPTRPFQAEGGIGTGGRDDSEGWNGYAMAGTRRQSYYAQASASYVTRDFWTLSDGYTPTANSFQAAGRRMGSDTRDWRGNVKFGYTPNATDEYTINFTKQSGRKGAPLNVYNNPPVPANSFWRWPYWDIQSTSLLTTTRLGSAAYVKGKIYYNTFKNGLDAFDDVTYSTQTSTRAFKSPYDDHAAGGSVELGVETSRANVIKAAIHYRTDVHTEAQTSRPDAPQRTVEPAQEQSQNTWSIALEDTLHVTSAFDLVAGISYDKYDVTKAQEYNATAGLFEYPKGGSDAFNWQAAAIWRHPAAGEFHVSVSDRARFPVLFELYSTRFGTATPNPNLGPERATNTEVGWRRSMLGSGSVSGAVFYSDVRHLIQTVQLPDTTTQYQDVGVGTFKGGELAVDAPIGTHVRAGGNYTFIERVVTDALQPNLRPTGVPTHKGMAFVAWQPTRSLTITPNVEAAGDRWSDMSTSPVQAFPYVRTGAYQLINLDATYAIRATVDISVGFKNLRDQDYELSWGLPQPGRTFYVKTRFIF